MAHHSATPNRHRGRTPPRGRRGHGTIRSQLDQGAAYYQDHRPVREQSEAVGHAVRATYLMAALAQIGLGSGDQSLLEAAIRLWRSATETKLYPTAALGSRAEGEAFGEPYELPPDRVYGETCATIGLMLASWRLLLATGEARFADTIDCCLHNLFAASTDQARTGFFYCNPAERFVPLPPADPSVRPVRSGAQGSRAPWFETACCPPNIMRIVAGLHRWVATRDAQGLQLHLFMPSRVEAALDAGQVALSIETDYPATGRVTVVVEDTGAGPWELALRRPAWAELAQVRVRVN
ncbi:MAG: glycoside hydrolase family 127 protein, partial [Bifidobacteriaceae bacterium]|nr:glycoside hydrolase family 127 protein [Bifidobacteriaceae bacterium]